MPDFVTLTLIANSAQVALLPLLVGGLWWITASARYIGQHRNRWWENSDYGRVVCAGDLAAQSIPSAL
ncbi:MAG: hypothetical protein U0X75_17610 [Acidobacteriota bacterium]